MQLGFLPRLTVLHTGKEIGQVYVPFVNWAIFTAVAALVIGFGSSDHLAAAYGIAVTGTLAIDTLLFFFVVRALWHRPLWLAVAGGAFFLVIDLAFFGANLPKVLHGGWFPLVVAVIIFTVLVDLAERARDRHQAPARARGPAGRSSSRRSAAATTSSGRRAPACSSTPTPRPRRWRCARTSSTTAPSTRPCVIISLEALNVPHVRSDKRIKHDDLGYKDDGICHMTARFGFQDDIDIPATLRAGLDQIEGDVDLDHVSYFISRATISPSDDPCMARWRKKLFVAVAKNASNPVQYFNLPDERTVVMGAHVEL